MNNRYKEAQKKIGLKGMFKIGSREPWTITGRVIYFVSLPEWVVICARAFLIRLLKAFGFYATKCGCRDGHNEWPLRFRLNRCKDCWRERFSGYEGDE
jgi:hypothetical protein